MLKIYLFNGRKVWLDSNNVPEGAVLCESKKKVIKAEPKEADVDEAAVVTTKARRATSNKARKAGSNK